MFTLRALFVLIAALLFLSPPALAQVSPPTVQAKTTTPASPPQKSPTRAALYSLGGTVGPIAAGGALMYASGKWRPEGPAVLLSQGALEVGGGLIMAGVIAGPAAGHVYANEGTQARIGMGIRSGATLVGGAALTVIAIEVFANTIAFVFLPFGSGDYEPSRTSRIAKGVATGAGVVMGGSILFDVATAPLSAHQYNEKNNFRVQVGPRVSPTFDQAGLAVHLQF